MCGGMPRGLTDRLKETLKRDVHDKEVDITRVTLYDSCAMVEIGGVVMVKISKAKYDEFDFKTGDTAIYPSDRSKEVIFLRDGKEIGRVNLS